MSLFGSGRLVISLPAAEIGMLALPGSVLTREEALGLPVSRMLGCTLALIEGRCRADGVETVYLARPEIFVGAGPGAAWLRARLGGATEHLCITDGSTVKPVDGCRTHIFNYRMSFSDSYASFWRLCRRAPALMAQVASQVNTRFAWGSGDAQCHPAPVYWTADGAAALPEAPAYRFQFRPYLAKETAARILASGAVDASAVGAVRAHYVPLTETALEDDAFARALALMIRAAFADGGVLLLRLPDARPGGTVAGGIAAVLAALAATGVVLPRHVSERIYFLTGDIGRSGPGLKVGGRGDGGGEPGEDGGGGILAAGCIRDLRTAGVSGVADAAGAGKAARVRRAEAHACARHEAKSDA
jgi:hypothetical protein